MNDREQRIRDRAHAIWEQEGRSEGQHLDHWRRAEAEYGATDEEAAELERLNREAGEQLIESDRPQTSLPILPSAD